MENNCAAAVGPIRSPSSEGTDRSLCIGRSDRNTHRRCPYSIPIERVSWKWPLEIARASTRAQKLATYRLCVAAPSRSATPSSSYSRNTREEVPRPLATNISHRHKPHVPAEIVPFIVAALENPDCVCSIELVATSSLFQVLFQVRRRSRFLH